MLSKKVHEEVYLAQNEGNYHKRAFKNHTEKAQRKNGELIIIIIKSFQFRFLMLNKLR